MIVKNMEHIKSKYKQGTTLVIITIAVTAFALNYLLGTFLARKMGSTYYGEYALAVQVLLLIAFITLLGTSISDKQYLANFLSKNKQEMVIDYIRWNISLLRFSYLICWLIATASLITMLVLHYYGVRDIHKYNLVVYMFWIGPLFASILLLCSYLLANKNYILSSFLQQIILTVCYLVYFFIAFELWPHDIDNLKIVLVFFLTSTTTFGLCLYLTIKKIRSIKEVKLWETLFKKMQQRNEWLVTSIRLDIVYLVYYLLTTSMFFLLQYILHAQKYTGYFSACFTISTMLWIIASSISLPFQPIISTLIETPAGREQLQTKINKANFLATLLFVITITALVLFSDKILLLFGQDFIVAKHTLYVLMAATVACGAFIIGQMILSYGGFSKQIMIYRIITYLVTIGLGIPLTYTFGMIGMAISYLLAMLTGLILIAIKVRCATGIRMLTFI